MIQLSNIEELTVNDIPKLLEKITPVLKKRKQLHDKYSRKADSTKVMYSSDNKSTVIPFEKFITDLATGYLSGKPIYSVADTTDESKKNLLNKLLDKKQTDDDYKKSMDIIIDYVSSYNDDESENYDLIHDILEFTSCYEILYENKNNEVVYTKYDPLQTIAIWDYNSPANLIGIVRTWEEDQIDGNKVTKIELTDRNGTRTYDKSNNEVYESDNENHSWGDVPAIAIETDFAIFETCEDIIQSYEQLIQNVRNTFQYNDSDCKLKVSGYTSQQPMLLQDEEGNFKINPARELEDKAWEKLDKNTLLVAAL